MDRRILPIALLIIALVQPSYPCAPAPPQGSIVYVVEESAIILWDAANHIEHFIRRATFQSDAPDFGFLVPTPTKPELAEAPDDAFTMLEEVMRPKYITEEEHDIEPVFLLGMFFTLRSASRDRVGAPPPVRILDTKRVAGYDAVVLEADDAASLHSWLEKHGYRSSPALQKWFEPYILKKWKITAFKIAGDQQTRRIGSAAVRMSFSTDKPFFPYREPEMKETPERRLLQVLLLSNEKVKGRLGSEDWAGQLKWADRLPAEFQTRLMEKLGLSEKFNSLWLNAFEDRSNPRPGHADLYFQRANNQTPVVPPPITITSVKKIPLPLDLFLLAGVIAFVFYRRRRPRT